MVADGMAVDEVMRVVNRVRMTGCRFWLEGGWGVDALVGHQTRAHRDVDIDFDSAFESHVLDALAELGYKVGTDWRPNRVELSSPGRGWVDLHPLEIDGEGTARQAALGGGWHVFSPAWFTHGTLNGQQVPCVSIEAQRLFRTGYDLRPVDRHDLAVLDQLSH